MGYIILLLQYLFEGIKNAGIIIRRKIKESVLKAKKIRGITFWDNLLYHDGHTWLAPETGKVVRIGIDEFAVKLLGDIDKIQIAQENNRLNKNEQFAKIISGKSRFKLESGITGRVIAVNPSIKRDPQLIARDPYGSGWLVKVRLENNGIDELHKGEDAEKWFLKEWDKLHYLITAEAGLTFADGGEITTRDIKKIDRKKWELIVKEFLKC
jgi:glycine cleavage system H lipoate-binding protein